MRVGHQRPHGRIEEARHVLDRDAAPGQDARQEFRHVVVALRDGERLRGAALVEPVAPGAAARRVFDAEKQAPRRQLQAGTEIFMGRTHMVVAANHRQKSLRYWMKPERSATLS